MPRQALIHPGELARERPAVPGVEELVEFADQEVGGGRAWIEPADAARTEGDIAQLLESRDDVPTFERETLAALAGKGRAGQLEDLPKLWIDQRCRHRRHP